MTRITKNVKTTSAALMPPNGQKEDIPARKATIREIPNQLPNQEEETPKKDAASSTQATAREVTESQARARSTDDAPEKCWPKRGRGVSFTERALGLATAADSSSKHESGQPCGGSAGGANGQDGREYIQNGERHAPGGLPLALRTGAAPECGIGKLGPGKSEAGANGQAARRE